MIFCNLGSGSKGNSTYLKNSAGAILVDLGFSLKTILSRFMEAGLQPNTVKAILVSHEHEDHIRGVGTFARKFGIPVYLTYRTQRAIPPQLLKGVTVYNFEAGRIFDVEDFTIKPFTIPHDAADPVGFLISSDHKRVAIVTDLGSVAQSVLVHIHNIDLLLLESNHDLEMLINGPYPLHLKQRIKSRDGHLSNEQALEFLNKLNLNGRLKHLILGHLSEINNRAELVENLFKLHPSCKNLNITITSQYSPTPIIEF